jgi:Fic family protein
MSFLSTYHKSFAMDPHLFEEDYTERRHSGNAFLFKIPVGGPDSFFYYDKAVFALAISLSEKNAKLNELYRTLPPLGQEQLIQHLFLDDVQASNEIEGLSTTKEGLFNLLQKKGRVDRFSLIVEEYSLLSQHQVSSPKSLEEIRTLYDQLIGTEDAETPIEKPDGRLFRKGPVGIYGGLELAPIHRGILGEEAIGQALNEALSIAKNPEIDFFSRSALFHFFFETIHPFYDGNGRTGRFLLSIAYQEEAGAVAPFILSAAIRKHRPAYYRAFKEAEDQRNKGDATTFVCPFLKIIDSGYDDTLAYLQKKQNLAEQLRAKTSPFVKTAAEKRLMEALLEASVYGDFGLTVLALSEAGKVGSATVNRFLAKLKKNGVLWIRRFGKKDYFLFPSPNTSL